jgi:hypothetical protein
MEQEARAKQRAAEPLTNEWNELTRMNITENSGSPLQDDRLINADGGISLHSENHMNP